MRFATGEGVFEEVEHGEEVSGRHQHVVTKPSNTLLADILRTLPNNVGTMRAYPAITE